MISARQTITLSAAAWETLVGHAAAAFPEECCGVLAGESDGVNWTVHSAEPCINRAPHARDTRFLIDPEDLLEIRRRARDRSLDLIGFYHSHPNKAAYFSARDLRECWPGFPNIVVPVIRGVPGQPNAFLADRGQTGASELSLVLPPGVTPSSASPPK